MKRKKAVVLCAAVGMAALLYAGCADSVQTEEEIVIPKETQEKQESMQENNEGSNSADGQGAYEGDIAGQVQAPENYKWEGGNGNVNVTVNARVVYPNAEGFKTYKVTSRVFTQEDYDKINQALFKGAQMWSRDYDKMADSNGFTAEEIEERVARLRTQKEVYEAGGEIGSIIVANGEKTYDELIAEWEAMGSMAPEEAIIKEVPAVVSYNENPENDEENWLDGNVTVDGQDYFVALNNNLKEDWRWISFEIRRENAKSSFIAAGRDAEIGNTGISPENIRLEAEKTVADMGFTDFTAAGEEYFKTYSWKEEGSMETAEEDWIGYGVHFTRNLEGIPVTYTNSMGTTVEEGVSSSWPYEALDIIYDEEGVLGFCWTDPYNIETISDEYVFLIPFPDIQNIFEEMILKKYSDFYGEEDVKVSLDINEIRLGYMRIMEKGNPTEGTMVPVWDFFGNMTTQFGNDGEAKNFTESGTYTSWLTINAMDGTIIDRDLGY